LLVATSGLLLLRPLFETSDWGYFSMAGLILSVVLAATTARRLSWWMLFVAAILLCGPTYGYTYVPQLNDWLFILLLGIVNAVVLATSAALGRIPSALPSIPDQVSGDVVAGASLMHGVALTARS
jgi:hypothetical protein